jgi:hypothetical protein
VKDAFLLFPILLIFTIKKAMQPKFVFFLFIMGIALNLSAQKFGNIDKSPMDISYYPNDFAHDRKFAPQLIGKDTAMIRIIYSRPAKKEREVFGKLVPFGKVWRTGANESAEIKFYQDVLLGGKKIKAGTYSLFTIPEQSEWTIILNTDLDQWGAYSYREEKDVLRFKVPVKKAEDLIESFSIKCEK